MVIWHRRLQRAGVTQAQARQIFTSAEAQLPQLQELQAQRGVEARTKLGLRRVYRSSSIPKSRGITTNTKT